MRIHSRLAAFAAATVLLAACGGSDSNAPDNSHVGVYALVSVDGETLPVTIADEPGLLVTLTEGAMTLNANNTFALTTRFEAVVNGEPIPPGFTNCNGSYRRSGNTITLTSTGTEECDAVTTTGTLSGDGNTLTVNDQGSVAVFKR
jgi:hypothetical protein